MQIISSIVVDCPVCGRLMRLIGAVPALGPITERRSYRCETCGELRATTIDPTSRRETQVLDPTVLGEQA
jgi:C4-type Zn-finger protein